MLRVIIVLLYTLQFSRSPLNSFPAEDQTTFLQKRRQKICREKLTYENILSYMTEIPKNIRSSNGCVNQLKGIVHPKM